MNYKLIRSVNKIVTGKSRFFQILRNNKISTSVFTIQYLIESCEPGKCEYVTLNSNKKYSTIIDWCNLEDFTQAIRNIQDYIPEEFI